MKKILLLFGLSIFSFVGLFAQTYNIDASFKSIKNGKTYFFDFTAKKYLRFSSTNQLEGTFSLTSAVSNWNSTVGSAKPKAVTQSPDGNYVFFFDTKNNQYWKMQWSNWEIVSGYPKALTFFSANWSSDWDADGPYEVQGALFNASNNRLYFFDFSKGKIIQDEWGGDWSPTYDLMAFGSDYNKCERTAKYATSAFTDGGFNFRLVNPEILSYVAYSGGHWVGPKPLTDFDGWLPEWGGRSPFVNPSTCTTYSLQGYGGHKMYPLIAFNMPSGTLGQDYVVKSVDIYLTPTNNQNVSAQLLAPNASAPIALFNQGDASGTPLGSSCNSLLSFSDLATHSLVDGSAPYTDQAYIPAESFTNLSADAKVDGIWYLDVTSQEETISTKMKRFSIFFEPKKELQCGSTTTYQVDPGNGAWDMSSFCASSNAAGKEVFYRFTPEHDGEHFISLSQGSGYGDYFIKPAVDGFNATGWSCMTPSAAGELSMGELTAGTTYFILIKAEETTGTGETFTIRCPTCPAPTNLVNDDGSFTSLGFTWDGPASANYVWQMKAGSVIVSTGETDDPGQFSVDDLLPGTEYTFTVKTKCADDFFSDAVSITVTTPECQVPSNLSATDITPTSFKVQNTTSSIFRKWQVVPAGNGMDNGIVAQGEINSSAIPVSGLSPGTAYDFYIQSKCGDYYSDPASLLNISTLVGIEDLKSVKGIVFYPNPVKNELSLDIDGVQATTLRVSIVSILGDVVMDKNIRLVPGANHQVLNVSALATGSYIVRLVDQNHTAGFRFVKE